MKLGFTMPCKAVYDTSLDVPDELANKWFNNLDNKDIQAEILSYIKQKLNEADISELEFTEDLPDEIEGVIELYDKRYPTTKSKTFHI